ncbi:MAG TPA: PilZ domain-containing protein [Candidatus Eremiobacteraceae bacterium]|nr:PilZ domain-containing protein [Candidatus Eremiobacteraceae bacterium]
MSTSTEYMDGLNVPAERRFYPRVTPPAPIYVAFGSNNLGVLHNVSENGFQVSTPSELPLNSVFRVFLSLNGSRKTISVTVRTVWTVDAEKRSGIQLLDLSDENRDQIRQWVEFEMSRSENSTPWFLPKNCDNRRIDGTPVNPNATRREPVNEAPYAPNRARPAEPSVTAAPVSDSALPPASETPRTPRVVLPTTAQPPVSHQPTAASFAAAIPPPVAPEAAASKPVAAETTVLPPIANPFDDPGPNPQFDQFPAVPLPIHGEFEYTPPSSSGRSRRKVSTRQRAKPLILWAAALALICFGANALVRYKINSASRRFAAESTKYTPPKSDGDDPGSPAPTDDSGANATAPADAQPSTNSAAGDSSASTAASSTDPPTVNASNDASSAATAPAPLSSARNSETTQPDPRRGSSLDADARASRAYAATAPPTSDRSEESARESQPAPAPRAWSAPAPNRSSSAVSASDVPQSPNVASSSNAPAQSNSTAVVSQARPAPPVTPVQTPATSSVSNSPSNSTSNSVVNNAPVRSQQSASSQQSSTYASNANTTPPSRPQSPIYNANTPAQRSPFMGSINSVHSSGIFDSNDSTAAATTSASPAASRGATANVAARPVSNASAASAPVTSMDVPQDRDLEIPAPKGFYASWVDLPGEHVVRSAAGTVHMHRMVKVPGERIPGQRWLWKGKLDVTLGDVVNRIDPSAVQASGASGSLTVMASIDKDGYVTDLKPLNGNFALLPAVSRTVRNWHYQPTYLDNKRAETQAQIEFDLRPVPVSASNRPSRQ